MEERYELVPREAYRYWPSEACAIKGSGRFAQRLIFKRQVYSEIEEEALSSFIHFIDTQSKLSPRLAGKVERVDLMRILYAADWDVLAAVQKLSDYLNWLEALLPAIRCTGADGYRDILVSSTQECGGVYTHGRDCYYRPIVILVPARLRPVRVM